MDYLDKALAGDKYALERILDESRDFIFNMSFRMLGSIHDAEDATQEILIKVMTNLSSFKKNSKFSTWVYKITVNYLLDYKKSSFYKRPLSFEIFGDDLLYGCNITEQTVLDNELKQYIEELKLSCTNVMLQCFNSDERMIFILGTMFNCHSKLASEVLSISPATYRKRLSRLRAKMAQFLGKYCGLAGGMCSCTKRVDYAISKDRISSKFDYG